VVFIQEPRHRRAKAGGVRCGEAHSVGEYIRCPPWTDISGYGDCSSLPRYAKY